VTGDLKNWIMRSVKIIKGRRVRWPRHVLRMLELRNWYRILVRIRDGKRPLEDLGVAGRIIIKWILNN
jgi:hypothetical protein